MKKLARRLLLPAYMAVTIYCILLVIKPGSSFFYFKQSLKREEIIPEGSHSYRYLIDLNILVFPPEGILLSESGKILERNSDMSMVSIGKGRYLLSDPTNNQYTLHFSATDNSDPRSNEKQYILYLPVVFISRPYGIFYLVILSVGLAWFWIYALKSPTRRTALRTSPANLGWVIDDFIDQELARVLSPVTNPQYLLQSKRELWIKLITLTIAAAYIYVFMEWLFFVTKPSFMDLMGWGERTEIFLETGVSIALPGVILILIFAGLDAITSRFRFIFPVFIGTLIPSCIFTIVLLLLVDNFTYTIFKFGIISSSGFWRGAYGLGFLITFIYIDIQILEALGLRGTPKAQRQASQVPFFLVAGLLTISLILVLVRFSMVHIENGNMASQPRSAVKAGVRPNILLIGGDGLSASHLSVYGYERDTTPTLRKLAKSSLLAENAFTNSAHSTGSIISIFASKLPSKTRVLFPPDILKGDEAFQHLPGILREAGYHTVQIGVPFYVDAYAENLLDGFDLVNQRSQEESEIFRFLRGLGMDNSRYFVSQLVERATGRLLHIFLIQKMENPYSIVTQPISAVSDRDRLSSFEDLIRDSEHPWFVHIHLMVTHGPRFDPKVRVFSSGETQDQDWMTDFYDDSILNFDGDIGEVLEKLGKTGILENTIVVIYSDHPMKNDVRERIPLIMHFPSDEYAGLIQNNVQNLDIAPTILDYMGIARPEWMGGQSLLDGNTPEHRLIFSTGIVGAVQVAEGQWIVDAGNVKPPFYEFTHFNIIDCSNWYQIDLRRNQLTTGKIAGHTAPCDESSMLAIDQAKAELARLLAVEGFDVSTLH